MKDVSRMFVVGVSLLAFAATGFLAGREWQGRAAATVAIASAEGEAVEDEAPAPPPPAPEAEPIRPRAFYRYRVVPSPYSVTQYDAVPYRYNLRNYDSMAAGMLKESELPEPPAVPQAGKIPWWAWHPATGWRVWDEVDKKWAINPRPVDAPADQPTN